GMSALMVRDGPAGLWIGLVVALAPLIALALAGRRPASLGPAPPVAVHGLILVLVAALLIWANIELAADVAVAFGAPRWHGIVIASGAGFALSMIGGAERLRGPLLVAALAGVTLPLLAVAQLSGVGPARAWEVVASRPAFRFSRESPWVTEGRDLSIAARGTPVLLEEEHRVTIPGGGVLRALVADGGGSGALEWRLDAGQLVTLRPGDRIVADPGLRLRFDAGRRIPGAPVSGVAWAEGPAPAWGERLALAITFIGGAIGFFGRAGLRRPSRGQVALTGAGLLLALALAQGGAVYGTLQGPEVFLGGVTAARITELPMLALGALPGAAALQGVLLVGLLAGFLASAIALKECPGPAGARSDSDLGRDLGLWAVIFAGAGVASLRAVDPWTMTVLAMGAAASAIAPSMLVPAAGVRLAPAATWLGLGGFVVLSALRLYRPAPGVLGIVLEYPAVVAAPASLAVLWIARRLAR
ncbi:MAG TPA: hypothetical protein VML54_05420, partial [Candidatus Limnocylindrales bacterium]|nr:hypothetical protein [Candidatus Limnocylindrales bacterium]